MVTLVAVSWKPVCAVNFVPPTVEVATTESAPVVLALAGRTVTTALPLSSVNALAALNTPSPPCALNCTTCPATPAPVALVIVAMTVPGAAAVTVVGLTVTAMVVTPAVPPPPPPEPPALPPPPPQAASESRARVENRR